jgi:hypothetical protein
VSADATSAGERLGRSLDWPSVLTFVLASLWLFGLGSLAALYVGRLSLRRTKGQPELLGRTPAWAGIAVAVFGILWTGLWLGLSLTA